MYWNEYFTKGPYIYPRRVVVRGDLMSAREFMLAFKFVLLLHNPDCL